MDPIEILLKEYESLRQEILAAMQMRNTILSFGLAIIGAIFTASIAVYSVSAILSGLALTLVVPAINLFVLFMWLGEYQRAQRAGKFLSALEHRINEAASQELLTWESSLRRQRHHMKYPYYSTALLLTVVSLTSLSLGLLMLNSSSPIIWALIVAGIVFHAGLYRYASSAMSKLRV